MRRGGFSNWRIIALAHFSFGFMSILSREIGCRGVCSPRIPEPKSILLAHARGALILNYATLQLKRHHLQPGVGQYGTFSGKRWNGQIYPVIRNLVLVMN
jgi:hypothetical protein